MQKAMQQPLDALLVSNDETAVNVRWEDGDLQEWSAITYPDRLLHYVETEFRKIKKRQAELLGIREGSIRSKL